MAVNPLSQIKKIQQEAQHLMDDDHIAAQDDASLHPARKFVHFWALVARSFIHNRCVVRATALAYTTLLALVPLLAVGLGVATGLLKSDATQTEQMIQQIVHHVAPQLGLFPKDLVGEPLGPFLPGTELTPATAVAEDASPEAAARKVAATIMGFIQNVHSGALGLTGTLALIFVAVGLLSTIERTFNDIWGVTRGRSWFARVVRYWTAITLGPVIVLVAMTFAVGGQFEAVQDKALAFMGADLEALGRFLFGLVTKVLPFLFLTASFALLYQLIPNTTVDWRAAAIGGGVGGLLWVLNGQFNVLFASKVVSASRIYGPLGILPVFLLALYFAWLILLFGAQVAYAFQHRRAYLQEKQAGAVNQRGREFVALRLMTLVGQRFQQGDAPPALRELGEGLGVSPRLLAQTTDQLKRSRLLIEVNVSEPAYAPSRPLGRITCQDILEAMRVGQGQEPATRDDPGRGVVREAYEAVDRAGRDIAQTTTLEALVSRTAISRLGTP